MVGLDCRAIAGHMNERKKNPNVLLINIAILNFLSEN